MYVAYGWPKLLSISAGSSQGDIVHLSVLQDWLLLVSSSRVQIWSASQHKTRLGQCTRDTPSLLEEGVNIEAVWSTDVKTIAVLTSESNLHFYHITVSEKQLHFSGQELSGLSLVNVALWSRVDVSLLNHNVTANCMAADDLSIVLGLSNGWLRLVSWNGELLGSLDILQGFVPVAEATYLRESSSNVGSPLVSPHQSPAFSPMVDGHTRRNKPSGFAQLELSRILHILVAVRLDGTIILCSVIEKGLSHANEITPERWVAVFDAVCASVAHEQQVLAVGTRRGTIELFNLADSALPLRTISLFDWGYTVEDTGPVNQISWTPDNCAFAVGWRYRGLAVWSASGCRLMCTIRQGSMSNSQSVSFSPHFGNGIARSEPMVEGVAALTWGQHAYQLFAVEQGNATRLVEFPFAKSCVSRGISGVPNVWQLMHGEDRVLLVQSDDDDELKIHYLIQSYIGNNWPVMHVAANEDGTHLAIAGRQGLILYDFQSKRWRVFGDITQEREIQCVGLVWLGRIIVLCNYREVTKTYELSLYPRYHLDETSLLCRKQLPGKAIAMDVWQDYILVTCPPFDIYVFKVHVQGTLSPLKASKVQLHTVRELSIMSARKPPAAMHLVPNIGLGDDSTTNTRDSPRAGSNRESWREVSAEAISKQPTRCMILRTDGELSLLDLDQGNERRLVSGIERFWLSWGRPKEEAELIKEVPWWAYGHRGMQVWYPSSTADTSQAHELLQLDPELDFDQEVYPLGLCPAPGVIVGVSQRLSLSGCADMPCFEPTPQAQPILPCLLQHLLQRNKMEEAVQLARLSEGRSHFSHSLEWLLFTVFDSAMSSQYIHRKRGTGTAVKKTIPLLLQQTCNLIQNFSEYLDVLVSVARKTDSRHWPELFAAAGKSTELFEECFEKGLYRTATCYILVIEKLEGSSISQHSALRLLKATLEVSMYELAGELVRFLLRCGREGEFAEKEADRYSNSLFSSFFLGFTPSTPLVGTDMNYTTVQTILEDHAIYLMGRKELRELVAFVKGTQFDLTAFLRTERGKSARLEDFSSALQTIGRKLGMNELQGRLDAEFLLAHMRTVGFREWIVVLATLLRRSEVLLEIFHGDSRLWQAYSTTLQSQSNFVEFEDLLLLLERDMLTAPQFRPDLEKLHSLSRTS
ncbi:hypothetical protein CY35_17G090800 [Sphagnum magellanicum]|nr:hypothetical protein CY35_17G090800 [Sphagnum magellanicum]